MSDKKPRLEWTHTDACNYLMSDPDSDTDHASRCLHEAKNAIATAYHSLHEECQRLRAESEDRRIALAMVAQYVGNMDERTMHYAAKHLRAERDSAMAKVAELEAENAELRKAGKGLCSNCGFACSIVDETEELKARLAWFEER